MREIRRLASILRVLATVILSVRPSVCHDPVPFSTRMSHRGKTRRRLQSLNKHVSTRATVL